MYRFHFEEKEKIKMRVCKNLKNTTFCFSSDNLKSNFLQKFQIVSEPDNALTQYVH